MYFSRAAVILLTVVTFASCSFMGISELPPGDEYARTTRDYSVEYASFGAERGTPPVDTSEYMNSDIVVVKKNTGNLQKKNAFFTGWNTASDGSGQYYPATGTESFSYSDAPVTFFPQFRLAEESSFLHDVYFNGSEGSIYHTTPFMEYSIDDGVTWNQCEGGRTITGMIPGQLIWIREAGDPANRLFLGSGRSFDDPDLISGNNLEFRQREGSEWIGSSIAYVSPGEALILSYTGRNVGSAAQASILKPIRYDFYLSTDRLITTADLLLFSRSATESITVDRPFEMGAPKEGYDISGEFIFPQTASGEYYIGVIADAGMNITESSEDNNRSHPGEVITCVVLNENSSLNGAVKLVNSWGIGGWENRADGHYWMTFNAIKDKELNVGMYYNNFDEVYTPTVLAAFKIDHLDRSKCTVIFTLGPPDAPLETKKFDTSLSGSVPFPNNPLALDISEFAYGLNDYDVYMTLEVKDDSSRAYIKGFAVELYSGDIMLRNFASNSTPLEVKDGTKVSIAAETQGSLSVSELMSIAPVSRSAANTTSLLLSSVSGDELKNDMDTYGVYAEGENYNNVYDDTWGTGYAPMSEDEWGSSLKLRGIEGLSASTVPLSIDHSQSPYFPPIANQGNKGSCTAFSLGYYIQTYTEAREHGWDLTGTVFDASQGGPTSNRDKIFSPDFIYHQINRGVDRGSSPFDAVDLIVNIGGAVWEDMPYNVWNINTLAGEAAWRKAGKYRGRENTAEQTYVYFTVKDDSDIETLKYLLNKGYCLSTGIYTGDIFSNLDSRDVYSMENGAWTHYIDHAQTIVGYKEGAAWDPLNPDQ